jgi:hypothetical protein
VDYEWQIPQVEYWLKAHGIQPAGSDEEINPLLFEMNGTTT